MSRRITFLNLIILAILIFSAVANAQSPEITSGLNYLTSVQNADGSWGNEITDTEIFSSTVSVIEALQVLNQTGTSNYSNALTWLQSQGLEITDYLSERIHALSVSGTDDDLLLSYLDDLTGAWGGYADFKVNNLDTLLALQALKKINYRDQNVISAALYYLTSTQNPDGGWGLKKGMDSEVYYTALVLNTLSQFKSIYNLQTPITKAVAYLLTKQNSDGGFGSSPSTVYETALAFEALIASGGVGADNASAVQNAINYLTSTQLPNGSWNDDPYSTALALHALADVQPNLSISTNDITFSPSSPTPGSTVSITANVNNNGLSMADNILVQFYDGDPATGGMFIGEAVIVSIPSVGTGIASTDWTASTVALHNIFVRIDPANTIAESTKTDNVAIAQINVIENTDLIIQEITFIPDLPAPGQPVTARIKAANTGGVPVSNVIMRISVDSTAIGDVTIVSLGGYQTHTVNAIIGNLTEGVHQITATADPDNLIAESNEANNTLTQTLDVKERIDLVASSTDIYLSNPTPKEGEVIQVSAVIYNNGESPANNVLVRIYSEDPAQGGTQLGSDQIITAIPGKGSGQTGWITYDTFGKSGPHTLHVVADPLNAIPETDKTNNTARLTFEVQPRADLVVQDIQFTPASPEEGDLVQIKATVKNIGTAASTTTILKFYLGDPAAGGVQIGSDQSVYILNPNATSITGAITFNTADKIGPNQIYAVIDPLNTVDEIRETNNTLIKTLNVNDSIRPDLTVSSNDISFAPLKPSIGDVITISAQIMNLKNYSASNVAVRFFDGDPASGGVIIGNAAIPDIQGMGTGRAEILWSPASLKGKRNIFVWVDPDSAIAEANELNNQAKAVLNIRLPQSASPVNLTAYPVNSTDIELNWEPGSEALAYGVIGYNIYRNEVLITGLKDISKEGTASASSYYQAAYSPDKAIDGSTTSQWWSGPSAPLPHWWQEDFPAQRKIKKVAIYWILSARATDYQVQTWDGAQWLTQVSVTGNTKEITSHEFPLAVMTGKVRVHITGATRTDKLVNVREVDIYEDRTVTATTYQDMGLGTGTYTYYATAVDADGAESLPSNEAGASLGDVTPPSPPTGLAASVNGFNVILNWNANTEPDLAGYRVYRDKLNVAHKGRGTVITGAGTFSEYVIDGNRNAVGGGGTVFEGCSVWNTTSPGAMIITFPKVYQISKIKMYLYEVLVSGISDNRFFRYKIDASVDGFTWQLVTDRTSGEWRGLQEEVFPQPIQVRYFRIIGTFGSADQNFCVTEFEAYSPDPAPLTLDTAVERNIQVNNYSNFSEYTSDWNTGTRAPRRLFFPSFATEEKDILSITDKDTGLLLASYTGNLGTIVTPLLTAANYHLSLVTDDEGTDSGYALKKMTTPGKQTARTYAETVYERGSYHYAITAIDTSGNESALSAIASAPIADNTPPSTPMNLAAKVESEEIDLTWTANTEADLAGYNIYRNGDTTPLNGSVPITTNSYKDLNVVNLTTYAYQITAVDLSGNESPKSTPVAASPSGIDLAISAADISFRPRFPSVFDNITVLAMVNNIGIEALQSPVLVKLYVGNPASGGTEVGSQTLSSLSAGDGTLVEFIWNPAGYIGTSNVYVVVDSSNLVPEPDESNNSASFTISVVPEPKLLLKVTSVDSSSFPEINAIVRVGDWAGEGIFSLTSENFAVTEDGRTHQPVTTMLLNSQGHKPLVDIVFVLDDTGSMHNYFDTLKVKIFDFVKGLEASNLDYLLGLVTFKDDVTVRNSGYLTGNETTFVTWIEGLAATWGGDVPENSLDALESATTLHFRSGTQKVFVMITDVQPHVIGDGTTFSHNTVQSITQKLQNTGAITFIAGPLVSPSGDPRYGTLEGTYYGAGSITQTTGGKFYYLYDDFSSIIDDLAAAIVSMMGDYRITYTTSNPSRDGALRTVNVEAAYRYVTGNDTGQYRAPLATKADLVVKPLVLSKDNPLPGDNVTFSADIRNLGGIEAKNVLVRFYDGDPATGIQIGSDQVIPSLLPSGTVTLTAQWLATSGTHMLNVIVDPLNTIDESDETNNTASETVVVPGSPFPDLGLSSNDIVFSKTNPLRGENITINATIHNTGAEATNILVLTFIGDPANGGTQIGVTTIPTLAAGSTATVQTPWTIDWPEGAYSIYIWIDPYNTITEGNETDNKAFRTLTVGQKRIYVDVATDSLRYEANSDVGITVTLDDSEVSLWAGTGNVYVEDQAGNQVAIVGTFTQGSLSPTAVLGYRVPVDIVAAWNMKNVLAEATVDFAAIFQSLGVTGKTVDRNSVRVYEFDDSGNRSSEKQAKATFQSDTLAKVIWLMDGTTLKDQRRGFSIYFNTTDNGPSVPSANTKLPISGKLVAFSDDRGTVNVMESYGEGTFSAPVLVDDVSVYIEDYTRGIVLDDFNGDGFLDIITGSGYNSELYYYRNKADGTNTFFTKVLIGSVKPNSGAQAGYIMDIVSGDFNNDGKKDFVVSTNATGDVFFFSGNGDGTFMKTTLAPLNYGVVMGKAAADFDGDGNLDLMVETYTGGYIFLYKGNGDGTFKTPVMVHQYSYGSYGLAAGDFNSDGKADIVYSNSSGLTNIRKGKGDGTFLNALPNPLFTTGTYTALASGDFNGDGKLDLIAATYTNNAVEFYPGNGDGTFGPKTVIATTLNPYNPLGISASPALAEMHGTIGTPETVASSAAHFTWNTGTTSPGPYRVHVTLSEGQGVEAEGSTPFDILPDSRLSSGIVSDKVSYMANETVTITAVIESASTNYVFENLTTTVTIRNAQDTVLSTEISTIALLASDQLVELKTYWNTSTNPPGTYPVTLEVKDATGAVLSTSTANLTISSDIKPSVLLRGQITVDKQSVLQGEPVNINYSVTNVGNVDLPQVDLSILIVHVVELTAYDTLTDRTSLIMNQSYANTKPLSTNIYSAKDYLVILRAKIGEAEETLANTYFRVEGAPSAPSLHSPQHGADIETYTPELVVNNASDPNDDDLTYEFELYSDSGLTTLVASSDMLPEGEGITSWHPSTSSGQESLILQENAVYYWRARAYDGLLYGEWMLPASFRVNVTDDPPSAPTLSSPANNSEVDILTPLLVVNNASDPDSDSLTYNYELALDSGFVNIASSAIGVFEGQGTTSLPLPVELMDNTWYYWRAQADDWLNVGPWMETATFFVNTANDAPDAPVIISPPDGSEITTTYTDIVASNTTDLDNDTLTYIFELDTMNTFDSPDLRISGTIPEGSVTTTWPVEGLLENTEYFTRVKASDGFAESQWSEVIKFFVNTINEAPSVPVLSNPSDGAGVKVSTPTLSVHDSVDPDRDTLTYEYELYGDQAMTTLVSSVTGVEEGDMITGWTEPVTLTENNIYYWRARAFDGELHSGWMPEASFMVNTANDAPSKPTLHAPAEGSSLDTLYPTLSINNAEDPDSDTLTYDFEIYKGGVLVDFFTGIPQGNTVTSVTLINALTDNTTYTWRAKAYDGDRYGEWMDTATFSVHLPIQNITATIDFDPNTLNQKDKGTWVTVYIELPQGYDVHDIIVSSLVFEGTVPVEPWPYEIEDYDKDGIPNLKVKFRRSMVINILPAGDNVPVHVTGTVGTVTFDGIDIIRVIH